MTRAAGLLAVAWALFRQGQAAACADGAACEDKATLAPMEMLQQRHSLDSGMNAGRASPMALPVPATWFHAARTGTSFLYTLLQQEGTCGGADVCNFTGGCTRSPMMKEVWDNCPGIWTSSRCDGLDHYNECAESALGEEYSSVEGKLVGFFRQPEQRLLSDWTWECLGGREAAVDDMAITSCPTIQEFVDARQGCVTKMLTWTGDIAGKVSMHCNTPGWIPTKDQVAQAKERLSTGFSFIGMTDQWNLSICLFNAMFGLECRADQFLLAVTSSNQTYDTAALDGFVDPFDAELWEVAQDIFNANLRRYGISDETCTPCTD